MLTESAGDGCTTRQQRPRQRALAVVSPRSPVASTGQGAAIPSAAMRPDLLSAISRGSVAGDVVGVVVGSGAVAVGAMGVDVGGVAGVAVGAIGVGVGVDGTVEVGVRVVAAVGVDSIAVGVADAGVGDGGGPESESQPTSSATAKTSPKNGPRTAGRFRMTVRAVPGRARG